MVGIPFMWRRCVAQIVTRRPCDRPTAAGCGKLGRRRRCSKSPRVTGKRLDTRRDELRGSETRRGNSATRVVGRGLAGRDSRESLAVSANE